MLEGFWLALHQSVCCGTSGGKPLWPPSVSLPVASAIRTDCSEHLWRYSLIVGAGYCTGCTKQSFNVPEHNNPEVWGQAMSALWSALQLQSWNSLPLPCGHCSAKYSAMDLQKGLASV